MRIPLVVYDAYNYNSPPETGWVLFIILIMSALFPIDITLVQCSRSYCMVLLIADTKSSRFLLIKRSARTTFSVIK